MKTFKEECKVIYLDYEYEDYSDEVKVAIVTELKEDEIISYFPKEAAYYKPFVCLTREMYEVIRDYNRNEGKFYMRAARGSQFAYVDGETERYHIEVAAENPLSNSEKRIFIEEEQIFRENVLAEIKNTLTELQYRAVYMHYGLGMDLRSIAKKEEVSHTAILDRIKASDKKIKKIIKKASK